MKKVLAFILFVFLLNSCEKLEFLNENNKDFTTVVGEGVFNGAVRAFVNQMTTVNVNNNNTLLYVQHWANTTYPDESRYNMVTRPIPANHNNALYKNVLMNLKDAKRILEAQSTVALPQQQKDNQLAIVEIMSVYAWSNIIETFGNMPYSEALDFNKANPKYDDALTVYKDLISRLDAAISKLNLGYSGMGTYDNIYSGNVASTAKWLRFANSLKLRMGLMLADMPSEATYAKSTVESAAPGAFSVPITSPTTGDKFALVHLADASANNNRIYNELVSTGRDDFVPANTLVDAMNTLNDPRRAIYFSTFGGIYVGGVYGAANSYTNFSHVNPAIVTASREGLLMDYVEVEFLLAEAAERGYTLTGTAAGTAEQHYNNAITASILYWGGTAANATTYLAQPSVAYSTATGNWRQKIGTQAWIAYWFRGFSAWNSWRRLDYPKLIATPQHVDAVAGIPLRYSYPVSEQTLNGANYNSAAAAIGGDNAMTRLFWDVGPDNYNTLTGK